jgi:tRNA(Ile)-lysidine synthase
MLSLHALISPDIRARFLADISPLYVQEAPLGLAVSGGADSLALLLLATACFPKSARVATVDHGLRQEAAREAAFVGALCKELGVPHTILTPEAPITGSVQMEARRTRYALLSAWAAAHGCAAIATAHQLDDQVETIVMRLNRGAGIAGLSGVRVRNGQLIRPLLHWRRAELEALVRAAGITPVDDPSNHDTKFNRVAVRQALANSYQSGDSLVQPERWVQSATALAHAHEALEWAAAALVRERLEVHGNSVCLNVEGVPQELIRRLLLLSFSQLQPDLTAPRGEAMRRFMESLVQGQVAMLGNVQAKPESATRWQLRLAPPRRH